MLGSEVMLDRWSFLRSLISFKSGGTFWREEKVRVLVQPPLSPLSQHLRGILEKFPHFDILFIYFLFYIFFLYFFIDICLLVCFLVCLFCIFMYLR